MTAVVATFYDSSVTKSPPPAAHEGPDAESSEARYQIGEVAERTGVTQRTLRFYEERGILQPSQRMEGGFRLYSDQDVERIELIKRLQNLLGLSLAEIKEMVDAEEVLRQIRATFRPDREIGARRDRLDQVRRALQLQREIVDRKLEQLQEMRGRIDDRFEAIERHAAELEEAIAEATASEA